MKRPLITIERPDGTMTNIFSADVVGVSVELIEDEMSVVIRHLVISSDVNLKEKVTTTIKCSNQDDIFITINEECFVNGKSIHIEERIDGYPDQPQSLDANICEYEEYKEPRWWEFWKKDSDRYDKSDDFAPFVDQ